MSDKDYLPLLGQKRVQHYFSQTFEDPGLYAASVGSAITDQLRNKPPEWGQGLAGYSTRVASQFGLLVTQSTIHEGTAAALHLDPRYIRSGQTGFARRFGHAIAWTFVTYDENRHIRPNVPIMAGAYGSGMISMYWHPDRFNPLSDGVRVGNVQMGFSVGINVIKEFTPELKRLLKR